MKNVARPTCAIHGLVLGLILMTGMWIFPIPVALIAWLLNIKRPFVDIMFLAAPAFLAIPLLGAMVGSLISRAPDRDINREADVCRMSIRGSFLDGRSRPSPGVPGFRVG